MFEINTIVRIFFSCFILVFLVFVTVAKSDNVNSQPEALPTLEVKEVAAGVFVHRGKHQLPTTVNHGEIANIGFIVGQRCVAVIDSGGSPMQGMALRNTIAKKTNKSICYVINTHVHPDHIFGNNAFDKRNIKFVGHHKLPQAINDRAKFYIDRSREQLGFVLKKTDIVHPELLVKDKLKLDLGNREIILEAHPTAHTNNDVSVYDAKTNTIWLADLLFVDHLPVVDGSLNGWLEVIKVLEKRTFAKVIPGHGPIETKWPAAVRPQKKYLMMLQTEIRAMIKQGKFLEEALNKVGQGAGKDWRLFNEFHKKNITTSFAELEWEN